MCVCVCDDVCVMDLHGKSKKEPNMSLVNCMPRGAHGPRGVDILPIIGALPQTSRYPEISAIAIRQKIVRFAVCRRVCRARKSKCAANAES